MNIPDILDKITQFILHFDVAAFFKKLKPSVVLIALIGMILLILGAFFSLIPQF